MWRHQQKREESFNCHAADVGDSKLGDIVRVEPQNKADLWEQAQVSQCFGQRSYDIQTRRDLGRNRTRGATGGSYKKTQEEFNDECKIDQHGLERLSTDVADFAEGENLVEQELAPCQNITRSGKVSRPPVQYG